MKKMKLAVLMNDHEYCKRFVSCLMNHYLNQMEIHVFSGIDQWETRGKEVFDCMVLSELELELESEMGVLLELSESMIPSVYLLDSDRGVDLEIQKKYGKPMTEEAKGGIHFVDKYQEVNRIVDEIMKLVGNEIREVQENGYIPVKTRIYGVYSLSENEFQLPFAVTMASILSEDEKVLVLDLQENSGFSQFYERSEAIGLEEILVMAQAEEFSKSRVLSCIGHLGKFDFIYPVENTECLCEANAAAILKILQMISQEFDYGVVILNFGSRFQGFFETLTHCQEVYLMQKSGGLCQWREYEFLGELEQKGYSEMKNRIQKVQVPSVNPAATSCERLVEQWKWNEFGDMIRRMSMGRGVMQFG